jgi:O-antigen ligase
MTAYSNTFAIHSPSPIAMRRAAAPDSRLAWGLFLLLNATLFLRPAEIVPQLEALPIYQCIILLCLLLALPLVARQFRSEQLGRNAITLCVIGMLPAVVLSLVMQGDLWGARQYGFEFFKVVLYYLLLITLVDSARRLRQFLVALAVFALVLNVVALLSYHKIIDLTTVAPVEERQYATNPDDNQIVVRLVAAGIYGNPNDLARIIVVGITMCAFGLKRYRSVRARLFWIGALCVFAYALQLTYSRGGLLALIAGIVTLLHAKYGTRKGGALLLLLLPALIIFDGRQTNIDTRSGTGQLRIKLWSEGLVAMRDEPLFGIGTDRYLGMAGNHAHNSFVEAYVETGFFGGTMFMAAFFLATSALYRTKSPASAPCALDPGASELWQMRPYLLSLIVGSIVGQFSSSREYSLPTYMLLGVASAYIGLASQYVPTPTVRMSGRLVLRLIFISFCTLIMFHLYTKANARY